MAKALLRFMLAVLTGATFAVPASAAPRIAAPLCGECCAYSAGQADCASSMCTPGAPTVQADEQSQAKPLAFDAGPLRASFVVPPPAERVHASAPTRSHGPPAYLRFGRLLL